jgi:hypothetical protein
MCEAMLSWMLPGAQLFQCHFLIEPRVHNLCIVQKFFININVDMG